MDIAATCLDAAGAAYPRRYQNHEITPLEGKSLMPILEGRARDGHPQLFFEHYGHKAVREGPLKLVADEEGPWRLYDLGRDKCELNDLARERPATVERLAGDWTQWALRTGAIDPLPDASEVSLGTGPQHGAK